MAANFRVEQVKREDMPRCMQIVHESFDFVPIFKILAGEESCPENWELNAQRHWQGFLEHAEKFPSVFPAGIKCVHTDAATGEQKIVGFAEWFIWDRERTEEEYSRERYISRCEWLEEKQREYCVAAMKPEADTRRGLMGGRPFGLLAYMCVDPQYRRMGAATACVRWGMDRCAELGIPAYLETSDEGRKTYEKLGWEVMKGGEDGVRYPPMIWWPPNVKRE